jgi:thiol-disulfide isomerase/thioredoxin
MIRILFSLAFILSLASITPAQAPSAADGSSSATLARYDFPKAGETRIIEQPEVERLLKTHGSELLVVNFWATFCVPCIEELPDFVKASAEYKEADVRFVGFSVDLKKDVEAKVVPFLKKRGIPYANVVLDVDPEKMISVFSKDWGGEIPVTFIFNKRGEKVGEALGQLHYADLKALIEKARK